MEMQRNLYIYIYYIFYIINIQCAAERSPLFGKPINSKPKKVQQMFFLFLESTQNAVLHRVF